MLSHRYAAAPGRIRRAVRPRVRTLHPFEEGLYYRSAERICAIFRSCVPDAASAQCLACNPKALANRVYAGRNGNRDEASGDGWRYRGRGLIQLTGRANYVRAAQALGRDYVEGPTACSTRSMPASPPAGSGTPQG